MRKILLFAVYCLLLADFGYAWMSKSDAGTCGAQFLKIGIGAKPMGMGGAASAVSDVNALYWNPAGIASLEKKEVLAQHTQWFEDTSIEFIGAVVPVGGKVFGLSMTYLAIDDFEKRLTDTSEPIGTFNASDVAAGITYAGKSGSLSSGLTVKALKSKIADDSSNVALAADVGFLKKGLSLAGNPMSLSLVLKDFGTKIKFNTQQDALPSVVKLGMSANFSKQLNIAADLNLPRDNEVNLNIGLEYLLPVTAVKFPLRFGYKTLNDFDTVDGFSAGFGIGLGSYDFDFAWVPYGDFDSTYRLSLSGKF
ncbi:MAG: PorV/PorQ family protein [bacterium]